MFVESRGKQALAAALLRIQSHRADQLMKMLTPELCSMRASPVSRAVCLGRPDRVKLTELLSADRASLCGSAQLMALRSTAAGPTYAGWTGWPQHKKEPSQSNNGNEDFKRLTGWLSADCGRGLQTGAKPGDATRSCTSAIPEHAVGSAI